MTSSFLIYTSLLKVVVYVSGMSINKKEKRVQIQSDIYFTGTVEGKGGAGEAKERRRASPAGGEILSFNVKDIG